MRVGRVLDGGGACDGGGVGDGGGASRAGFASTAPPLSCRPAHLKNRKIARTVQKRATRTKIMISAFNFTATGPPRAYGYTAAPGRLFAPPSSSVPPVARLMPLRIAVSACKFRKL